MKEKPQAFRTRARLVFFTHHGEELDGMWVAKCQVCGLPMADNQADTMHKQHSGMGGATRHNTLENVIIGHGHRTGPNNCHWTVDNNPELLKVLKESPVNVLTGGVVEWKGKRDE